MTAIATQPQTEVRTTVAGRAMRFLKGGTGPAIVTLHHSTGSIGWLPLHERLAERFTVYVPDLPGYGQSERPDWARDPRDLAILTNHALGRLGEPEHVASVAAWLLDPENDWITGQVIGVDGGLGHILARKRSAV